MLLGLLAVLSPATVDAASIRYDGEISRENNALLLQRVAGQHIDQLLIDSPGGSVEAGIALGNWLFDHGIDVVVDGYCLSSCANYVFTAARHKTVRPGAVVAWHGNFHHLDATGLWRDDVAARVADGEREEVARREIRALVERLVGLEKAFFNKIGVDQYLCWVGKQPPYSVPYYYFLSAADMRRFGVDNVSLPPGYENTPLGDAPWSIQYLALQPATP